MNIMKNRNNIKTKFKNDNRPVSVDVSCLVYNHGKYLRRALDGMLMQETSFPVKIYIHDDASTDDSSIIIQEYKERYPEQIIAIIEKENYYQNGKSVWLKMFPYYTAKYIAYCEGDDYWTDPHKLQKQVDYLEKNQDCVACYHNILPVDNDGNSDESLRGIYTLLDEGDYTKNELRHVSLKTQTASLMRRNYNPWLSDEDKEIYLKTRCNGDEKLLVVCGSIGRVHYLSDTMAAHRIVKREGFSWSARQNKKKEYERFIGRQIRYLELYNLYEYFHKKKISKYDYILDDRVNYYREVKKKGKTITKDEKRQIRETIQIPWYTYVSYIPYFICKCMKKLIRTVENI